MVFAFASVPYALIIGNVKLKRRTLSATKITPEFLWLIGACPEFLDELPMISTNPEV